jgi:hypothetical protein
LRARHALDDPQIRTLELLDLEYFGLEIQGADNAGEALIGELERLRDAVRRDCGREMPRETGLSVRRRCPIPSAFMT